MNYEAIIAENSHYKAQNEVLSQQVIDLKYQLDKLQRMLFGRKSERFISAPIPEANLFSHLEDPVVIPQQVAIETSHIPAHDRKKSSHKGRTLMDNLPADLKVDITILEPQDKPEGAVFMGSEIQRKLAYTPGKFSIKQLERNKYIDKTNDKIYIAPKPAEALEKSEADPSLIADVVVSKFVDHIPEYRKQQQYKREGVVIPPSTMNDWTHNTAKYLQPLAQAIKDEILASNYIQVDESTIKVMQKDKTKIGYMWVINNPQLKMSYFDFHPGRGAKVPKLMLENYSGALQSDGYSAYEVLEKVNDKMTYFNCWAHPRRKFEEALKHNEKLNAQVLQFIQKLYKVEKECRDEGQTFEKRKELRQQYSLPVLKELKDYLDTEAPKQIDGTPTHKAIGYTLKRWSKLVEYVHHGHIEIDNNLVENAIRPLALGRKNYLFAGSAEAAASIAIYYTIFSSCKSLDINPNNYLIWVLNELPNHTIRNIGQFTPAQYISKLNSPD